MASVTESVDGLTEAMKVSNQISKAMSGFTEILSRTMTLILNTFILPFGSTLIFLLNLLVGGFATFTNWVLSLPKWFNDNIFAPISNWIEQYLVQPFQKALDTLGFLWNFYFQLISGWIETYIVDPFWNLVKSITDWVRDYIYTPFKSAFDAITGWVYEKIFVPFFNYLNTISGWINDYVFQPFWDFVNGAKRLLIDALNSIIGMINNSPLGYFITIPLLTYEKGGKVPGSGPVPIIAHGGETITPAGQSSGNTFNFYGYQDEKFIQKVKDVIRSQGTVYNL